MLEVCAPALPGVQLVISLPLGRLFGQLAMTSGPYFWNTR